MEYIALHINGWLNGTVCRFLTKAEKSIWGDFCALGGSGEGRIGYVEEFKHIPYSREELLKKTHCLTVEDIASFDSCHKKCLEGVTIADEQDKARISLDEYGCIKIENWNTYQHSDFPQGLTEKEAKALKKAKRAARKKGKLPVEQEVTADYVAAKKAKEGLELLEQANSLNSKIVERMITQSKVEKSHKKGGNYQEGSKPTNCKCMTCGKTFSMWISNDEITQTVNKQVINVECTACRKDKNKK